MTQLKGSPPCTLGWEVSKAVRPNPSPQNKIVEFGARSKGQRGSPTGSVHRDQVGLVCPCVFFFFFNISEIVLQPPELALSRGLPPHGVYIISRNTVWL